MDVGAAYLADVAEVFRTYKGYADGAMAQVDDDAFFATLDGEANSIALIVKHVAGNLRSRWTDFLTSDGEKPDRHRDTEFERHPGDTRASLTAAWERGWATLLDSLASLTPTDLQRDITVRGEPQGVLRAINRSLAHTAQHVGQIVLLAKHHAGPAWRTLSIPRGQSETFTAEMARRRAP